MKERRDPATIARTANIGFYIGADERGAAKGEALYQAHFGKDPRGGFLRGTARQALPRWCYPPLGPNARHDA